MSVMVTVSQALHYILKKLGKAEKIKLVKLLYLADKYHLLHYGRTITDDAYFAMRHGPVGSAARDVLTLDEELLLTDDEEYALGLLEKVDEHTFRAQATEPELDMLSDTDKEALDFIVEKFGQMDDWQLAKYTHRYPEWSQYRSALQNGQFKRAPIERHELLSVLPDDPLGTTEADKAGAERLLSGAYD